MCKRDCVEALGLCSEDTCVCSKLKRPQPDRGEQATVSSTGQGHVCVPCQPTGMVLLLFPGEFVCSSSNVSAYVLKDKGKVRPQLADLPGGVALWGCATCHHRWQSADALLTGHGQGSRNSAATKSWNLHDSGSTCMRVQLHPQSSLLSQAFPGNSCMSCGIMSPAPRFSPHSIPQQAVMPTTRRPRHLLESLVEVSLLEQLKDVSLLRLEIQVCRGDWSPSC